MKCSFIKKQLELYTVSDQKVIEFWIDARSVTGLIDKFKRHPMNVLNRRRNPVSRKTSCFNIDYWSRNVSGRPKQSECFHAAISI
jgi:hypothetical protein